MMPDLDGYEVCRRLKLDPNTREIPIIFLTARTEAEDETRGFELGAVDYIHKPFSPAVVQARVQTHLTLREAREQLAEEKRKVDHLLDNILPPAARPPQRPTRNTSQRRSPRRPSSRLQTETIGSMLQGPMCLGAAPQRRRVHRRFPA